jgi:Flp pilus assembly pilin Flp
MNKVITKTRQDKRVITIIEYGIIVAIIAIIVIAGVKLLGMNLGGTSSTVATGV